MILFGKPESTLWIKSEGRLFPDHALIKPFGFSGNCWLQKKPSQSAAIQSIAAHRVS
jgi:hypothetical protein